MKPLIKPPTMSAKAFASMVKRNKMTPEKIEALRVSLERGKKL